MFLVMVNKWLVTVKTEGRGGNESGEIRLSVRPSQTQSNYKTNSYRTWFIQALTLFIFKALWCTFCACLRFYFKSLTTPIEHRFAVAFEKCISGDVFFLLLFFMFCAESHISIKTSRLEVSLFATIQKNYFIYVYTLVINLSLNLEKTINFNFNFSLWQSGNFYIFIECWGRAKLDRL